MKSAIHSTKLPINCDEELLLHLKKRINYRQKSPKIKRINNCFVTFDGLVLKYGRLVGGCAFNLKRKEDKSFYSFFWKDTFEKYIVSKCGKSIPNLHLDENKTYILIHSKWFNYSFWITSFLPRLIQIENEIGLENVTLIYPQTWGNISYVKDSLMAFNLSVEIIPQDHQLFVPHLLMPTTRDYTASFFQDVIVDTKNKLTEFANIKINNKIFPTKIYLSRSLRGVRSIENESEVILELEKFGYEAIVFEKLNFWEQVAMMSKATHFISLHGAGLSNLMFMNKSAKVLEFVNRKYAELEYTFPFWRLASCIEIDYFIQFGNPVLLDNSNLSFGKKSILNEKDYLVNSNVYIEIELLKNNLSLMENVIYD